MPIVNIEMWPVQKEWKPKIIRKVTEAFTDLSIPAEAVTIVIHETDKENWGSAGVQHSEKFKDIR